MWEGIEWWILVWESGRREERRFDVVDVVDELDVE